LNSTIGDLEKLGALREAGVLTDDEFRAQKARLLAAGGSQGDRLVSLPNLDAQTIRRLSEYAKFSGIAWLVLGAIQICLIVTAIAGVWNVMVGLSRLGKSKAIAAREPSVPQNAEATTQLIVVAIANLLLGAAFGLILVGFDLFIRDRILANAHLFDGHQFNLDQGD
jgi:hypothetical protein